MIQRIVFDAGSYSAKLRKRSFAAVIFFPMSDNITGEPLVTLAQNVGLPPVKDS